MSKSLRAFTILELLMVVAIVALLAALTFAVMGPAREQARQQVCVSNLHQLGRAFMMYQADYDGGDPIQGQKMTPAQLGLPDNTMAHDFYRTYVRDDNVTRCPNSRWPTNVRSYYWQIDEDVPDYYKFSSAVERRGGEAILLYDDWHNPPVDPARAPRWIQKRIIVLRLNQQVKPVIGSIRKFEIDF